MSDLAIVFQHRDEFERARLALASAGTAWRAVEPPDTLADVAAPFLIIDDAGRGALAGAMAAGLVYAGHVAFREPLPDALADLGPAPPPGADDIVGRIAVAMVAACTSEERHLRLVAQVEGDLAPVMPYLNAEVRGGTFVRQGPTFTFMDGPRLITLYPHRVTVARAREMHDAWRTLGRLKRLANVVWARRDSVTPSYERRVQVSALELFSRLPRTNCRRCGEATCLAFAARVMAGEQRLERCAPVFSGERPDLRPVLVDLATALGL